MPEDRQTVYGDTLNIVDSGHSLQGNSFLYKSNRKYPLSIYYIKWIDVEPNTDYTFSAKYCITEKGNGFFGLIPGYRSDLYKGLTENLIYHESTFAKVKFDESNHKPNCEWQSFGITFNTGDRNRIGFVVHDKGGTAYIDDLRLFKTENAASLTEEKDNTPDNIVSDNKNISVSDGLVTGIEAKTKISSLLKNFKNSEYLRVFDADGNEITDTGKYAATGIELRLMNGPVIKDRAALIVKGDVNGDGLTDGEDSVCVIKHLSREQELETVYLKAADFDGDGNVTVNDAVHSSTKPSGGNAEFRFDGPKEFAAGQKIEVSLITDTENIKAFNGLIRFNGDALTLMSISADISGWEVSSVNSSTEAYFSAVALEQAAAAKKGSAVITFTFKVGKITDYSQAAITLSELTASSGGNLLNCDSVIWDNTSKKETVIIENKPVTVATTETVQTEVAVRNRLSSLKLEEAELSPDFDPDIKEYTATVPFSVKKVTVTAVAADEDATVTVSDTNLEYVGRNLIKITVLSAEGQKRTYKITVTREVPVKNSNTEEGISNLWIIFICAGILLLLAAAAVVVILVIKRKKAKK